MHFTPTKKKTAKKSGDGASAVKKYKYADILWFLVQHLKHRETSSNLLDEDNDRLDADQASTCSDFGHIEDGSEVALLATSKPSLPVGSAIMSSFQATCTPASSFAATPRKGRGKVPV